MNFRKWFENDYNWYSRNSCGDKLDEFWDDLVEHELTFEEKDIAEKFCFQSFHKTPSFKLKVGELAHKFDIIHFSARYCQRKEITWLSPGCIYFKDGFHSSGYGRLDEKWFDLYEFVDAGLIPYNKAIKWIENKFWDYRDGLQIKIKMIKEIVIS